MQVYAPFFSHLPSGHSRAALGAGGLSSDATEILGWANGVQVEGGHGCCGGAAHNLKLQRGQLIACTESATLSDISVRAGRFLLW